MDCISGAELEFIDCRCETSSVRNRLTWILRTGGGGEGPIYFALINLGNVLLQGGQPGCSPQLDFTGSNVHKKECDHRSLFALHINLLADLHIEYAFIQRLFAHLI